MSRVAFVLCLALILWNTLAIIGAPEQKGRTSEDVLAAASGILFVNAVGLALVATAVYFSVHG